MKILNNRGFSLIELMIGISVMVLIMAGVSGIMSQGVMSMQHNISLARISATARNAINTIEDGARLNAVSITVPPVGGSDSQLTYSDGTNNYVISLDSSTRSIIIKKGSVNETTLANGLVESLTFTRTSEKEIAIKVAFNDKVSPNSPSRTVESTLNMVNYGKTL